MQNEDDDYVSDEDFDSEADEDSELSSFESDDNDLSKNG